MPDMQGEGKRKVYPKLDAYRLLDTKVCKRNREFRTRGYVNIFNRYEIPVNPPSCTP